jgi:hypothetical protein
MGRILDTFKKVSIVEWFQRHKYEPLEKMFIDTETQATAETSGASTQTEGKPGQTDVGGEKLERAWKRVKEPEARMRELRSENERLKEELRPKTRTRRERLQEEIKKSKDAGRLWEIGSLQLGGDPD